MNCINWFIVENEVINFVQNDYIHQPFLDLTFIREREREREEEEEENERI